MTQPRPSDIDETGQNYEDAMRRNEEAKEGDSTARKALLALVPKAQGEHVLIGQNTETVIEYPPKVQWDADEIAAVYGDTIPGHVKRNYSIDQRVYRSLPDSERDALRTAFTTKPGTPTILIKVI